MAEGLFRAAAEAEGFSVCAAGAAADGGESASTETLAILAARGIDLDGFGSRMVDDGLVRQATHVFCMTRGHLDVLDGLYPEERDKFHLGCDFSEIEGEVGRDVPDPFGGGLQTYEKVATCLDQAIEGILGFLRGQQLQSEE